MENLKIEKHEWAAGQGFYGEQSTFPKDLGAISRHCLFQSDANMRSFSSMENVGGAKGSALLSQDLTTLSECDGQINEHSVSKSSKRKVHGGSKPLHDKSQVVSSCFEQPAACTNGEITPDDDGVGASQACTKSSFRLDCKQIYNLREQRDDEIPIGDLQQSTSSSSITTINYSSSPFQDVVGKDMTQMPNKRRRAISDLSPWYKEVTGAARQHNSMSNTELDWARTTNRLTEKIVAECLMRSGQSTARSWRRLIWTTQLMQQLFPPLPCISLTANASSTYENIAYTTAKSALTDACSHMCSTEVNRVQHLTGGDMISKEINTSEKDRDCSFSNILENCLQRFRKLETGFLRWEKGYSTLDLRMECHDLEKYTTIIRFARFHVLAETDGLENSIQSANCEVFLQRHVTALRTPEKLPKGLSYLSL